MRKKFTCGGLLCSLHTLFFAVQLFYVNSRPNLVGLIDNNPIIEKDLIEGFGNVVSNITQHADGA